MPTHLPTGLAPDPTRETARLAPVPEPASPCAEALRALYVLLYQCSIAPQHEGAEQVDEYREFGGRSHRPRD